MENTVMWPSLIQDAPSLEFGLYVDQKVLTLKGRRSSPHNKIMKSLRKQSEFLQAERCPANSPSCSMLTSSMGLLSEKAAILDNKLFPEPTILELFEGGFSLSQFPHQKLYLKTQS